MASRGHHGPRGRTNGRRIDSRKATGVVRLTTHRHAKFSRESLNRLHAIRESVAILSEAAVLSDEENSELRRLATDIEHALNFAFTQSH